MLRVATVLSAREWEARFVAAARESAAVRLVMRAYLPDEVAGRAQDIDVVVAGAETPWITATRVAAWRRLGLRVVGVHQTADAPAAERLAAGGADLVLEESIESDRMVREIRLLEAEVPSDQSRQGRLVAVTGCRGAPGRTEIAVALAWAASRRTMTALVDADLVGASIAVRLGLPPRPDLADCVDQAIEGEPVVARSQAFGRLSIVPGALRPAGIRSESALDVAEALAADRTVIADVGPWVEAGTFLRAADSVLFVVEATPIGIVRASRIVESWDGATPSVVLNKVRMRDEGDVVAALRRWTGLDAALVIPRRRGIQRAAAAGTAPDRHLVRLVSGVAQQGSATDE